MFHYSKATLIYIGNGVADNGSPIELKHCREVKVTQTRNFSLNFYNSNGTLQRSMRNSRNIVIPAEYAKDICIDGVRYELLYVNYQGLRYRVQNILNYRKSGLRVLLDIEELR